MSFWRNLNRVERRMVLVAAVILLGVGGLFYHPPAFLNGQQSHGHGPVLGQVIERKNDARHRSADDLTWFPAERQQGIYLGDAIFAGPSSNATVEMNAGESIHVRENSMVVFEPHRSAVLPDFKEGEFSLKLNGKVNVAIRGKVTTFDAVNTEVSLTVEKHQAPRIKVTKGRLRVTAADTGHAVEVKVDEERKLDTPVFESEPVAAAAPEPPPPVVITPRLPRAEVTHEWHFYELYAVSGHEVTPHRPPDLVDVALPVEWDGDASSVKLQTSTEGDDFARAKTVTLNRDEALRLRTTPGVHALRVSADGATWSAPVTFGVTTGLGPGPRAVVHATDRLTLRDDAASFDVTFDDADDAWGYVVELARDADFANDSVLRRWTTRNAHLSVDDTGAYFVRARAVTRAGFLAAWSDPHRIDVAPTAPAAPVVAAVTPPPPRPAVLPAPSPVPAARAPAAALAPATRLSANLSPHPPLNLRYGDDLVSLGTGFVLAQSSQQAGQDRAPAHAPAFGVRVMKWFGNSGLHGGFWTSAGTPDLRAFDGDLQYRHRVSLGRGFGTVLPLQLAPYAGFKVHGNASPYLYARRYALVTAGAQLLVPTGKRWSTGLRLGLGLGQNSSVFYDGQVQFGFHLTPVWSAEFGYAATYLDVRARAIAPAGLLPYREGYEQYRLGLNYYF